jgi:hypothetical protein
MASGPSTLNAVPSGMDLDIMLIKRRRSVAMKFIYGALNLLILTSVLSFITWAGKLQNLQNPQFPTASNVRHFSIPAFLTR